MGFLLFVCNVSVTDKNFEIIKLTCCLTTDRQEILGEKAKHELRKPDVDAVTLRIQEIVSC